MGLILDFFGEVGKQYDHTLLTDCQFVAIEITVLHLITSYDKVFNVFFGSGTFISANSASTSCSNLQ